MKKILISLAIVVLLASCQSLQKDLFISGMDETVRADLLALEETIVNLEASPRGNAVSDARRKINSLSNIPDNEFQAQLAAWSGRLHILEGVTDDARRDLRRSQTLSAGNWVSVILASRLERDAQERLKVLDGAINALHPGAGTDVSALARAAGYGEMQIEKARVLLETGRFPEAVAAFDIAFMLLEGKPFYRQHFQASRDRAWDFRNIDQGTDTRILELAAQDGVNWLDIIEITKTETDLLRFLTAGRNWTSSEIFARLLERSFIPLTQDVTLNEWPVSAPKPDETVLRSGTAWFLWRLYAENRAMRGLLSRYSSRYANIPGAVSPIADLPLLSPFFDSILGCVESEFMSLPDGKNFLPSERVRGPAFLTMLKKLN